MFKYDYNFRIVSCLILHGKKFFFRCLKILTCTVYVSGVFVG
ncbi:hypothetical protein AAJ76_8500014514 [Vairimorpha ceranae]|uniref:Uncharacterized protein n=1 Tax=Vairimorpha ceranae TaxID=40302 RepID=A0A0F9Z8Y0_9MICR|nr:hypothetical protein AAJ76_8500014514 [Vairimorpha ceranae]KKO74309.1 hypothetical protein AAJ76_8500014514 [Vairimorpha ceranae]